VFVERITEKATSARVYTSQSFLGWSPASNSEAGRAQFEWRAYRGEDASELNPVVVAIFMMIDLVRTYHIYESLPI
jgi:hypothetical protein